MEKQEKQEKQENQENQGKIDYASAGVNLKAGDEAVDRIKKLARSTFNKSVLSDIGSFGGLFRPPLKEFADPILVSSTDSVGTKLKLAFMTGRHNTIGQCIVNHCVNDILVQGARPLFFMDYIGVGKLDPDVIEQIVVGLTSSCKENDMALLGGETAELPGFYAEGEYDLVGTIVGIVDAEKIVDGKTIADGDIILGLPSVGLHTNGFSLARKICFELAGLKHDDIVEKIGAPIGRELLTVHKSYLKPILELQKQLRPAGMAHITGGGIGGNLVRILPQGIIAEIDASSWPRLPIFDYLQNTGVVSDDDMFDAFNMGIGYIVVVRPYDVEKAQMILKDSGQSCHKIGQIIKGEKGKRAVNISNM